MASQLARDIVAVAFVLLFAFLAYGVMTDDRTPAQKAGLGLHEMSEIDTTGWQLEEHTPVRHQRLATRSDSMGVR